MRARFHSIFAAGLILTALPSLTSCLSESAQHTVSRALGIDASSGSMLLQSDSHGGLHGDGTAYIVLHFDSQDCLDEISENAAWQPLPLSDTTTILAYGNGSAGPYLTDENHNPLLPEMEHGYYYFEDRQSENPRDDSKTLTRFSINVTLAVYDTDTDTLYYCKEDT